MDNSATNCFLRIQILFLVITQGVTELIVHTKGGFQRAYLEYKIRRETCSISSHFSVIADKRKDQVLKNLIFVKFLKDLFVL